MTPIMLTKLSKHYNKGEMKDTKDGGKHRVENCDIIDGTAASCDGLWPCTSPPWLIKNLGPTASSARYGETVGNAIENGGTRGMTRRCP